MTQNELLVSINSNIRDEEGYLELLQSKGDIHIFLFLLFFP